MTISGIFDKYEINYQLKKTGKSINIFKIGRTNLLFWINDGNTFKMKREWFEELTQESDKYSLLLYDKTSKKYYYLKFLEKNNWLSNSFNSCEKNEIFLGKQVLNSQKGMNQILVDLKKCSSK